MTNWRNAEALADQHRWDLKRLSTQQESASAFEFAVLEEVLARKRGPCHFRALIDLAINEGFNPLAAGQPGQVLVAQDQILEACTIGEIWLSGIVTNASGRRVHAPHLSTTGRAGKSAPERRWLDQAEQLEPIDLSSAIARLVQGLLAFRQP